MDESMWEKFDRPVLRAIADRNAARDKPSDESLSDVTGFDLADVRASLERLYQDGLIEGAAEPMLGGNGGTFSMNRISATGQGLVKVDEWPGEASSEVFIELLRVAISNEQDPVQKSGLKRFKDSAQQLSVSTLSAILAELAKRTL